MIGGESHLPMFYRIRKRLNNWLFFQQTRRILQTRPIECKPGPLAIVSMVRRSDLQFYLLAVKSLYRRIGMGSVVVIADRDLDEASRSVLRRHVQPIEFVEIDSIDPGRCQRGGTWERLLYCLERSRREFVIQIDSDVLCTGNVTELNECIASNTSFCLSDGMQVKPLAAWKEDGEASPSRHIVVEFERRGAELPDAEAVKYVRASSGFAGFARGCSERAAIEEFHENAKNVFGQRWLEWGSEQIGSNFAIANSPACLPLPWPKYSNYMGGELSCENSLLHFLGTWRFQQGHYARLANREIDALL